MTRFDTLVSEYSRLPENEQLILQIVSVIYEPVNQTTLNQVISGLYSLNKRYHSLNLTVNGPLKKNLADKYLIIVKNNNIKCNPLIDEWLTLKTLKSGEFMAILDNALYYVPLVNHKQQFYHFSPSPHLQKRQLRYALYQGDYTQVFELLDIKDPYAAPGHEASTNLVGICANPLHADWFGTLHPAIQYQVLYAILNNSVRHWSNADVFFQMLEKLALSKDAHPAIKELRAEQCLYRGDWTSLQEDLATIGTVRADLLMACLLFLKGDTEKALAGFQSFVTRTRKQTRKRRIAITELPGVIYLLTLLKDSSPGNSKLAAQQMNAVAKLELYDAHHNSMLMLEMVRAINEGQQTFDADYFDVDIRHSLAFTTLTKGLVLFWNNQDVGELRREQLEQGSRVAKLSGYGWFVVESYRLLAKLDGVQSHADEQYRAPLTEVVLRLQNWERSLNALAKLSASAALPVEKKNDSELRVAWFIGKDAYNHYSLKPKEQKLRKNGTWTAGRPISLKRLAEERDTFSFLCEADTKICQNIQRENDYSYYGYSKHIYTLGSVAPLYAAIGHPHLYREDEPDLQMEIVGGQPELRVIEQGQVIRLILEPYPLQGNHRVVEESHSRLRIFHYSDEVLHIARILAEQGLDVPRSAKDRVLESVSSIAPLLTVHSDIAGIAATSAEHVDADRRLFVHLQPQDSGLRLSFHVQPFTDGPVLIPGHGGETIFSDIDGRKLETQRDLSAETALRNSVISTCVNLYEFSPGEWCWEDIEDALEGLLQLQSYGDEIVLTWPQGKQIKLSAPVGVSQMSVSLRQKMDWFELDGELTVDSGQVYSMQSLLELMGTSSGRFIELADGEFLSLTAELRKRLDDLNSYHNSGQIHSLNALNLEESIEGMTISSDKAWQALKKRLKNARKLKPQIPSTVQANLRDYQIQGFDWLCRLSEWGAGACLADDMGLGKTLQALALLVSRAAQGPSLVIAPTSVCNNWIDEALRFTPTLNPVRFGTSNRSQMLEQLKPYDLLICSYGLLQSEAKALQGIHWTNIVADEAQAFKNPVTKRSKAVMGLAGDFKMIATGTPIENHLGELWNLFQFINPGLLGSHDQFNKKFASPIESGADANASTALKKLISPFILRRLKRDVLTELPARTEIMLRVDPLREEAALYEAIRQDALAQLDNKDKSPNERRFQVLASLTRLRRAVCNPNIVLKDANLPSAKLDAFDKILDDLLDNNHKALVFSQFVDHLSIIRKHVEQRGIEYQYLDGSTSIKKRTTAINAFQSGAGELFLISLKAGGVGLNLTAADYVIHMDPWWNPAVEDQASDRAHRIGQTRPVTVYRIVANNTIEEKIVKLHKKKRDLADSLLEGTEVSAKMTLDDMLALLS